MSTASAVNPEVAVKTKREPEGIEAADIPLPPPITLPAASNTTIESDAFTRVCLGTAFTTSPSTSPTHPMSNCDGRMRTFANDGSGCVVFGSWAPTRIVISRRVTGVCTRRGAESP